MSSSKKAFTLIELLIVVAIIAILAAIAVPNFLEAQVRSKVSRAKADLRSMATAIEAYAVDNNVYPYAEILGTTPWLPPGGPPVSNPSNHRVGGLTSPIAYMTSLPHDSFEHPIGNGVSIKAPLYYEKSGFGYLNGVKTINMGVRVPPDALGVFGKLDGIQVPDAVATDVSQTPDRWLLYSIGPDLDPHLKDLATGVEISRSRYNLNNRYDPTNGTISAGNIIRFSSGMNIP